MTTYRKLGTADDHDGAAAIADTAYARANNSLAELLRSFATADEIPAALKISDNEPSGWHGAEAELDQAVQRGDWPKAQELADAYLARVERFCASWKARANQSLPKAA